MTLFISYFLVQIYFKTVLTLLCWPGTLFGLQFKQKNLQTSFLEFFSKLYFYITFALKPNNFANFIYRRLLQININLLYPERNSSLNKSKRNKKR